ncbi:hypothetical protein BBP40_006417 [Aspergillus hancockii]|nr:hypothetical protein BBP40_006417 [Aspergillus hancockii]
MTESYDPEEDRRSPGLEVTQPDYKLKESPPPFLIRDSKEPEGEYKISEGEGTSDCSRKRQSNFSQPGTTEGNSVLISYIDPNRPDIANYERLNPLRADHFQSSSLSDRLEKSKPEKPKSESPVIEPDEPIKPQPSQADPAEAARHALELLEPKPSAPLLECPEDSPLKLLNHVSPPERVWKAEPESPKIFQPPLAAPNITEKISFSPASPLSQYVIHSAQDVLPPFHSPDTTTTLPPIQTALRGIPHVKEPSGRANGPSSFPLPPVTASSPPSIRSDPPVWEQVPRPGQFAPPQVPPSPYSHLSPASTKDLSAVSSPASQNSYWRPALKSDIPYITSTYDIAHSAAKSPATNYPTPTDQTPGGTCERTSFNTNSQPNGVVPTGSYKCRHPGCTAPPFQTQYLLK